VYNDLLGGTPEFKGFSQKILDILGLTGMLLLSNN